jgi:hypothetical protein
MNGVPEEKREQAKARRKKTAEAPEMLKIVQKDSVIRDIAKTERALVRLRTKMDDLGIEGAADKMDQALIEIARGQRIYLRAQRPRVSEYMRKAKAKVTG